MWQKKKIQKNLYVVLGLILILSIGVVYCNTYVYAYDMGLKSVNNIDEYVLQLQDLGFEINSKDVIVKFLSDFDGNKYVLLENKPTGYYIFDYNSGLFIEGSPESTSPYYGEEQRLIYAGCKNYIKMSKNGKYINTISKTEYSAKDIRDIKTIHSIIHSQKEDKSSVKGVSFSNTYKVNNYKCISSLKQNFGYVSGGYCGYIAASMLISYNFHSKNSAWISNIIYYDSSEGGPSTALTRFLIRIGTEGYGYGASTVSTSIEKVMEYYCSYYNIKYDDTSVYLPTFNKVESHIQDNHAVILFGNMPSEKEGEGRINHAVLCYGVLDGIITDYYIVHFGWKGYSNVYISKTNILMGSMYSCW